MNYEDKLILSRGKAAEHLLATKILDLMDKLRMGDNHFAARRWIWELIQNAKDVNYEQRSVEVYINLESSEIGSYLEFKHNGKPFNADNITFLIQQVSNKDRDAKNETKQKTTGKFGTGFLSTHLLSEIVKIDGVVKEENLPYKEFSIVLDRSPRDIDGIITSVNTSLSKISSVLSSSEQLTDFTPSAYNTTFTYHLSKEKISLAKIGIEDLHRNLPYTLAFSNEISVVMVKHEKIRYEVISRSILHTSRIEIVTISENEGEKPTSQLRQIAIIKGNKASIGIEVEKHENFISFQGFKKDMPKLFCDFPLIGSEEFPFPVIVNSACFNPNEPRNGVWLTRKEEKIVLENEAIMEEAVTLYYELLKYASENNWANMFELCRIQSAIALEWLSKTWFDEIILYPIRAALLATTMIDTSAGRKAMRGAEDTDVVYFPDGINSDIIEHIWGLANSFIPDKIPLFKDVHKWAAVLWENCASLNLPLLAKYIEKKGTLLELQNSIHKNADETINWLNHFYRVMSLDTVFEQEVLNNKYAVIPNQHGTFLKRDELKIGKEIEEEIKDVIEILGEDIRKGLLHTKVFTGSTLEYTIRNYEQIVNEINTQLQNTKVPMEKKYAACDYLVAIFPELPNTHRDKMYNFSRRLYPNSVGNKKNIKSINSDIWKESDKIQTRAMVRNISEHKCIANFIDAYKFESEKDAIKWMHEFIVFLRDNEFESQLNLKSQPILPNQLGDFKIKDELSLDDGLIPEDLKIICKHLGTDFKETLLDKGIFLELPQNRTILTQNVADEILKLAIPAIAIIPRPEKVKNAFKLLHLYFIKYPEQSKQLFGDLYVHKHKLYDDIEIADNLKKAEELDAIMKEFEITSIDDFKTLLKKGLTESPAEAEQQPLTKEILASWGITSEEEYLTAMGSDVNSNIFKYYSIPTVDMYQYAQSIINRAKQNIISYLKDHPQYDISELDSLAPTVLGGIKKEGVYIHIVFRPSDNGEVLFYYPSEKITLDLDNAELWVEDGKTDPFHLTLGKILMSTGINRIPIHGITH